MDLPPPRSVVPLRGDNQQGAFNPTLLLLLLFASNQPLQLTTALSPHTAEGIHPCSIYCGYTQYAMPQDCKLRDAASQVDILTHGLYVEKLVWLFEAVVV